MEMFNGMVSLIVPGELFSHTPCSSSCDLVILWFRAAMQGVGCKDAFLGKGVSSHPSWFHALVFSAV